MDTYENDAFDPRPEEQDAVSEPSEQEQMPTREQEQAPSDEREQTPTDECSEPQEDGFYHGVGAGSTETTYGTPFYCEKISADDEPPVPPVQPQPEKPKRKRRIGKKVLIGAAAIVVAIGLVISGCAISVGYMNRYWQKQNDLQLEHYRACLDVLQERLDAFEDGTSSIVTVTQEGMTPSEIYQKNIHAVVAVNCVTKSASGIAQSGSAGSGFVISADGYVVTNHHVIDGATTITATFSDGTEMDAVLVGSDSTNDIALLKVDGKDMQYVTIGSSDALAVGEQVVAIGNALGELSFSLTVGYVSGMDRDVSTDGTVINMIQTDVAINSGNSGGPLFNNRGEVVGITSAKYSGTTSSGASIEGIGFAIPMDDVVDMLDDLREYGKIRSAYLGIQCYTLTLNDGTQLGVCVKSVVDGGSASNAGVRANDVIVNLGGYDIGNLTDLTRALRKFVAGDTTTIELLRNYRQSIVLQITFVEAP